MKRFALFLLLIVLALAGLARAEGTENALQMKDYVING